MTEIKYYSGTLTGNKYKPGITFDFHVAVPMADCREYALLVEHDGLNDANVSSMLKLADEEKAPYCVNVGVMPGYMIMPNGTKRGMRMNSYDLFDREYGDFIVFELIPYIAKEYSIKISNSPDMHMTSGGSSGGISAFVLAWFHPDFFRRVFMSSPSFLSMGRGNEIPYLIRKYETKPIRIYEEFSQNEPNDYFGCSTPIDQEAREALEFAGYDFKCKYFEGEGHCSRYRNESEAYDRNEWLWRGWRESNITPSRNSPRVDKVIPSSSEWEICEKFPEKADNDIPKILAQCFDCVVLSNDAQAFYAADKASDIVLMYPNAKNLSVENRILHATLHTIARIEPKGVIDMASDKGDRLFALTSIGIQCIRSFGLIDVILDLPDNAQPLEIAIDDALYVKTATGSYKRELCSACTVSDEAPRKAVGYYD